MGAVTQEAAVSESSMTREQLLGLFVWLMFQRHDGIVKFTNDEIAKYPGMDRMQVALEINPDGITVFVVEPESVNNPTGGIDV
jgi:hypothetical protein